jgi:tight adherence protein C
MGMRAGLGFDQAFELYAMRFRGKLAQLCQAELQVWKRGLVSRDDGLESLAKQVSTQSFTRFVRIARRGLRYGSSISHLLVELAADTRREYRSEREEEVAKAPVKMLIPTGVLILPAMLLLVLGPILLDLMERL